MANVVADKLTQANQIKEQIRTAANAKNAGIPEGAPFADYPGYLEGLPEQLENVPITLDFSGGDQTITAADGTVVKSATIQKPANLIPENIAEGVDIAGIVGALAAGGVGGIKIYSVTKTLTGTWNERVNIDFGFTPDLIVVLFAKPSSANHSFFGVSSDFCNAAGFTGISMIYFGSSGTFNSSSSKIDGTNENDPINNATATGFNFGKSHATGSARVIAVGLT